MSDKVIACPICGQSDFIELGNGKYKCQYDEVVWEKTLDDEIFFDLRQAHNYHKLYNFEKAVMLFEDIYKEASSEEVRMVCNYGALLSLFGVKFIKDKEGNIITTLANYQEDYNSIKETKYYKEIISSNYKYDYVDKLNKIDKEYERLQKELAEKPEYDIFICCKVTPFNPKNKNEKTEDNKKALELYDKLSQKYNVFYSEVKLSGVDYDAQIYSALMRSRMILVISSSKEYLESPWVQSEWRRWLNFIDVELKEKKSLFLCKLDNFILPNELSRTNVISDEDELLNKISNYLYTVKDNEVKNAIDEAKTYLKIGKDKEAHSILDKLSREYENDHRPWVELIEWLEYTKVNREDGRYRKFLNEALQRAKGNEINKIKQRYADLLVKEDSNIDIKLNEASADIKFKEYLEAEKIYKELCKKYPDYRPWYGLFQLLVIQNVDKKDERYKIYIEQAINLCSEEKEKKRISCEYKSYLKTNTNKNISDSKKIVSQDNNMLSTELEDEITIKYSKGLIYKLNESKDGYTVSGIGECTDADICIPSEYEGLPITNIHWSAFRDCVNLKSIVIPHTIKSIGKGAFAGCIKLESMTLPFVGGSLEGEKNTHFGYIFGANRYKENNIKLPISLKTLIVLGGTSIKSFAFADCANLVSISIPDSINDIGCNAFKNCKSLTSINIDANNNKYKSIDGDLYTKDGTKLVCYSIGKKTNSFSIPDSVKFIGEYAFNNCINLKSIKIPESVIDIGVGAFSACTSLTNIIIPKSVTNIGIGAFEECSNLVGITLPFVGQKVDGTGNTLFKHIFGAISHHNPVPESLKEVIITGGKSIEESAFRSCRNLTSITIPESVTSIGNHAFVWCENLKNIKIPNGVTSIGRSAFSYCSSLTSIIIPKSVQSIDSTAFDSCTSLTSINVDSNNIKYKSIDGNLYNKDGTELIRYSIGKNNDTLIIPKSVERICTSAFQDCPKITNVYYGGTIETWCNIKFNIHCQNPMNYAEHFYMLDNNRELYRELIEVNIPNTVSCIGDYQFYGFNNVTSITIPKSVISIGENAFYNCSSLFTISIPFVGASSEGLHNNYFGYIFGAQFRDKNGDFVPDSLKEVIITGGKSIEESAFRSCRNLTRIEIPNSVISIGDYAFVGCKELKSIKIPNGVTNIGVGAFDYCSSLTNITVDLNNSKYKSIDGNLYNKDGTELIRYANGKKDSMFIIPKGVLTIKKYAFDNCTGLTSLKIPESTINISENAFYCPNLSNLYVDIFNMKYKSIDGNLYNKEGTELIRYAIGKKDNFFVIPKSVTCIGDHSFAGCSNLTMLIISEGVKSINSNAFLGCTNLTRVEIPNSVTSIGSHAFYYCRSLTSITIPNSVKSIGNGAFRNCASLTNITIPFVGASSEGLYDNHFGYIFGARNEDVNKDYVPISLKNVKLIGGEKINSYAFKGCLSLEKIIIPESIKEIGCNAFSLFTSLTIYCEAVSKPKGWSVKWNSTNRKVIWGYQDESLNN